MYHIFQIIYLYMTKSNDKKKEKTLEDEVEVMYQKKDQRTHVYEIPDTYIGSCELDTKAIWVFDDETQLITFKNITFVPGFFKIFDEILVNARDHQIRDNKCNTIKVSLNVSDGSISVYNNGEGIPVVKHNEHKIYIPELIFGNLLTSSDYDTKNKITGSRNGLGAKLTNIFSKLFEVETVYINKKEKIYKKYNQKFRDNLTIIDDVDIIDVDKKTEPYTKITFYPDYARFGMKGLDSDIMSLLKKRVYDISACTHKNVAVYLNEEKIKTKTFEDFICLHYNEKKEIVYEEVSERWRVGVVFDADNGNNQVSFVNGIYTYKGGTHVDHVINQIIKKLIEHISQKHKMDIKPNQIKEHLVFFIDSVIENPGFSSQTKEELITKTSKFGSSCEITPIFINRLVKTGLIDLVISYARAKEMSGLKKLDGKKTKSIRDIPKLEDATFAGTSKSKDTRLILTEGDSAKGYAIAGIEVLGNDYFGVVPIKGKIINVRSKSSKIVEKNEEVAMIMKIMGLKYGKKYNDVSDLRYGGIIILTDQDADGSHIKGLVINMFQFFWPELLKITGFIQTISTPLLKVFSKNEKIKPLIFYTMTSYEKWVENCDKKELAKWQKAKYYKGLGTSTSMEAKEIFIEYDKRVVSYKWEEGDIQQNSEKDESNDYINENSEKSCNSHDSDDSDVETEKKGIKKPGKKAKQSIKTFDEDILKSRSFKFINMAFLKTDTNERKKWLSKYDHNDILEYDDQFVTYSDFINKDLIHFSNGDNIRSIPSLIDGLKPSQRKILHVCIKKNITKQIKVSKLANDVSGETEYHNGETSLEEAIVGMAQNFPGSNNINLLYPAGSFGYRLMGGKDRGSGRYIFTRLDKITKKIFIDHDNKILKFNVEEGVKIEPEYFYPIIPMILVNGSIGIGTGYSTTIHQYNPIDVCNNIMRKLNGKNFVKMNPWYYGFKGTIEEIENDKKYKINGVYDIVNANSVHITEIPIRGHYCWTYKYKELLESLCYDDKKSDKKGEKKTNQVQRLSNYFVKASNNSVDCTAEFKGTELQSLCKEGHDKLENYLKLNATISTTNMWLYTHQHKLKKYSSVIEILEDFYDFRLAMYGERRKQHLKYLNNELELLKNKIRFIKDVIAGVIVVANTDIDVIINKLKKLKYPELALKIHDDLQDDEEDEDNNGDNNEDEGKLDTNYDSDNEKPNDKKTNYQKSYKYLTSMKLFSLTSNKIKKLNDEFKAKEKEYDDYNMTTEVELWKRELQSLIDFYNTWINERIERDLDDKNMGTKKKGGKTKGKK